MKKVLIIAHFFLASARIPGLAKYLPEFGWQPIILTKPIGEEPSSRFVLSDDFKRKTRVIETYGYSPRNIRAYAREHFDSKKSYKKVKRFLKFLYGRYSEIIHYPDAEKNWKPFAVKAGDELLRNEGIDAMISSSRPVTAHLVAKELKNKYKIPWIADLRDLWSQNANYPYGRIRRFFDQRLELKTLKVADALITVSSPMTEKLRMLHKGKRGYTITNGFDPEKMSDGKANLTSKFTITYTGQIYTKQDPSKLLVALKDLISQGTMNPKDVELRIFGPKNEQLEKQAEKYGLVDVVMHYGTVPREVCFQKQRESQVLWQITWEDPKEKGAYSGKIFEYLGAYRPILATGGFGSDVVEKLIEETNSGCYCPTIEDVTYALKKLFSEYKLKGAVSYHGNIEKINKYSYREMARKFAEVLEECKNIHK